MRKLQSGKDTINLNYTSSFQQFTLTYRVFDGQVQNTTTVLIDVEAVNLFPPAFDLTVYTIEIPEEQYSDPVPIPTVSIFYENNRQKDEDAYES